MLKWCKHIVNNFFYKRWKRKPWNGFLHGVARRSGQWAIEGFVGHAGGGGSGGFARRAGLANQAWDFAVIGCLLATRMALQKHGFPCDDGFWGTEQSGFWMSQSPSSLNPPGAVACRAPMRKKENHSSQKGFRSCDSLDPAHRGRYAYVPELGEVWVVEVDDVGQDLLGLVVADVECKLLGVF